MKISTRTRYGLRLMFELALHYQDPPVHLRKISKKEGISEKYLGQIVIPLKSSGLIESVRGASGGYNLAKTPAQISIKDIVEVLEGEIYPVEFQASVDCNKGNTCVTNEIWKRLGETIEKTLSEETLETMLVMYKDKMKQGYMFNI